MKMYNSHILIFIIVLLMYLYYGCLVIKYFLCAIESLSSCLEDNKIKFLSYAYSALFSNSVYTALVLAFTNKLVQPTCNVLDIYRSRLRFIVLCIIPNKSDNE